MKLFNNVSGESSERIFADRPVDRAEIVRLRSITNHLRDEPQPLPVPDPLRFDVFDDELDAHEPSLDDQQDPEADFENVDVQAILFYGYCGRRCFPSFKAL